MWRLSTPFLFFRPGIGMLGPVRESRKKNKQGLVNMVDNHLLCIFFHMNS